MHCCKMGHNLSCLNWWEEGKENSRARIVLLCEVIIGCFYGANATNALYCAVGVVNANRCYGYARSNHSGIIIVKEV